MKQTGQNAERRRINEQRFGRKVCARCSIGAPAPGYKNCQPCLDAIHDRMAALAAAGLCVKCGKNPREEGRGLRCADCRGKTIASNRASRGLLKLRFFALYGGRCACCGETNPGFLTIDHVNGDGAAERKIIGPSGFNIMWRVLRQGVADPRYRALCFNCNQARGIYGECPHVIGAEALVEQWKTNGIAMPSPLRKLTDDIVRQLKIRNDAGEDFTTLARELGVTRKTVSDAIRGITWKHVK